MSSTAINLRVTGAGRQVYTLHGMEEVYTPHGIVPPILPWVYPHIHQSQVYQLYCTEQRTSAPDDHLGSSCQ